MSLSEGEERVVITTGITEALAADLAGAGSVEVEGVAVHQVYVEIDEDGNTATRADLVVQNSHLEHKSIWFYEGCSHGLDDPQRVVLEGLARLRFVVDRRPKPETEEPSTWLG